MVNGKEIDHEIVQLKLDVVDRLERYDLDYSKLRAYEDELRAIATMPSQQKYVQGAHFMDKGFTAAKPSLNRLIKSFMEDCAREVEGGK